MERTKLINLMSDVEPALSANQLVPVLAHFWFTGKAVMAYNGRVALSVACPTEFKGAAPPSMLSLLKSAKAAEITMTETNGALSIKAASVKIKCALMPSDDFVFKMPAAPDVVFPCDAGRFLEGLECCMQSLGNDTSSTDHLGVTLIVKGDYLHMFATDRATLSTARVKIAKITTGGGLDFERVIMPTDFCRQLLRVAKGAKKLNMIIDEKTAIVENGGVLLYATMFAPEQPADFLNIMAQAVTKAHRQALVPIPSKFEGILDRACIVTDSAIDKTKTKIVVANEIMKFHSVSERGEVSDQMQVGAGHIDVAAMVDPRRLKDGQARFEHMLVTEQAVIMTRDDMVFLVSATPA